MSVIAIDQSSPRRSEKYPKLPPASNLPPTPDDSIISKRRENFGDESSSSAATLANSVPVPCDIGDFRIPSVQEELYPSEETKDEHPKKRLPETIKCDTKSHAQTPYSSRGVIRCMKLPRRFGQERLIHFSLDVSPEITRAWESQLSSRFDKLLCDQDISAMGHVFIQLARVGEHPEVLAPRILILCQNRKQQKRLQRALQKNYWEQLRIDIRSMNLDVKILVDEGLGPRTQSTMVSKQVLGNNEILHDLPFPVLISRYSDTPLPLRIRALDGSKSEDKSSPDLFQSLRSTMPNGEATIGGLIAVDNHIYGLTAGHAFIRNSATASVTSVDNSSDGSGENHDDDSEDDSESDEWNALPDITETDISDSLPTDSTEKHSGYPIERELLEGSNVDIHSYDVGYLVAFSIGDTAVSNFISDNVLRKSSHLSPSDWGLIDLTSTDSTPGSYPEPTWQKSLELEGTLLSSEFPSLKAEIHTNRKSIRGCEIGSSVALIQINGHRLNAWPVSLPEPLKSGDSGAWVLCQNKLSGIVVAGSNLLSLGYMLPIEDVFKSIQVHCQTARVSLLSESSIQQNNRPRNLMSELATHRTYMDNGNGNPMPVPSNEMDCKTGDLKDKMTNNEHFSNKAIHGSYDIRDSLNATKLKGLDTKHAATWIILVLMSLLTFIMQVGFRSIAPIVPRVTSEFNEENSILQALLFSAFALGKVTGPLIMRPLLDSTGFYRSFNVSNSIFVAFTLGCALARCTSLMIVFRFFQGVGSNGPTQFVRILVRYSRDEYRSGVTVFGCAYLLEFIVGPVICGYLFDSSKSWRLIFWITMSISAFLAILCSLMIKKYMNVPMALDKPINSFIGSLSSSFWRPLQDLYKNTINLLLTTYISTLSGFLLLIIFISLSTLRQTYNFDGVSIGLTLLAIGLGELLGAILLSAFIRANVSPSTIYAVSLISPAGFFLYGWSLSFKLHWIAPVLGVFMIGTGVTLAGFACFSGLHISFYRKVGLVSISFGMNGVFSSLCNGLLPLAGPALFNSLGPGLGSTVLGSVSMFLGLLVFVVAAKKGIGGVPMLGL